MSELINQTRSGRKLHWLLLSTVSALALIGSAAAKAADADDERPTVWIELGGQLSRLNEPQETFAPSLMADRPTTFAPSQKFERGPLYSIDESGQVSFQPHGSDWVFSASIHYGRSNNSKSFHQQTVPPSGYILFTGVPYYPRKALAAKFADTEVHNSESHTVADFQAGKDVGLGMFSDRNGSATLNFGVRFAQFSTKSNWALKSDPDWHWGYQITPSFPNIAFPASVFHSNAANVQATRSFRGVGPSIAWNATSPFVGNAKDGELTLDWGVNAAMLFGRQRANVQHQTTAHYRSLFAPTRGTTRVVVSHFSTTKNRARNVFVPNVGGFAGMTFRVENFKMSAGYRADFFFGAMDGGIDAAKKENVGFYGPFASVSVGTGG